MSEYREQHRLSSNLESRLGPSPNEKGRTDIVFNTVYVRNIKYIAIIIFALGIEKSQNLVKEMLWLLLRRTGMCACI